MLSSSFPDFEEEIPCVAITIGLPPERLDHVVGSLYRTVRDMVPGMRHDSIDSFLKHLPDLLQFRNAGSFDYGDEPVQRLSHDLLVLAGEGRLEHLPEHIESEI